PNVATFLISLERARLQASVPIESRVRPPQKREAPPALHIRHLAERCHQHWQQELDSGGRMNHPPAPERPASRAPRRERARPHAIHSHSLKLAHYHNPL